VSALLVRLGVGTNAREVIFAVSKLPDVKAIAGGSIITSSRHSLTALAAGTGAFTALMIGTLLLMVGVLFAAIIAERRREVGLLMAMGARRTQVIRMLIAEAGMTTGLGGALGMVLGVSLLAAFQRSVGYFIETLQIPFVWPTTWAMAASALSCVVVSYLIGVAGAWIPAWRACREEPYVLVQSAGG
jgi:putative ABC transport system permease protein